MKEEVINIGSEGHPYYSMDAPKSLSEQRRDFIDREMQNAEKLITMQKFSSEEEKIKGIEKIKSGAEELFNSWAANIRAGITADDINFLDQAENPYNYMGMSAEEKMRLYDLQERIKIAREEIKKETAEGATTEEKDIWHVGAKKNPDGSVDLSQAAIFRPKGKNPETETKQPLEQKKEKLEGEELFRNQIENNSHPTAKNLKEELALFIGDIEKMGYTSDNFKALKEGLSEILYRNDLEYEEGKDIKVNDNDKKIIEPVVAFREELDKWNTFTETKVDGFKKRILEYLKETFGVEIQEPVEGGKYDSKTMQAVKVEKTENRLLDYKIKKILGSGFRVSDELFDYYKKWYTEKEKEMNEKHRSLKGGITEEEFDKVVEDDRKWLGEHQFTKSIRTARVEIYRAGV